MARLTEKKLKVPRVGPELHLPRLRRPKSTESAARKANGGSRSRLHADIRLPRPGKSSTGEGLVGLQIEADSVAVAEVRGDSELSASAVAPLPAGAFRDGEVIDPAAIASVLKTVFSEHKLSKQVRLGIANQRVIVRTIQLPQIDDPAQLEAAVRFQAEEQIPMPIDQAILDHRIVGANPTEEQGATIDIVVCAARREMIASVLKPIRAAGLTPVGIDLSAFGLIRALAEPAPVSDEGSVQPAPGATVLYCAIGDPTNLAIARGRACLFTRVSKVGLEDVVARITANSDLTPEHARLWLFHVGLGTPIEEIEGEPTLIAETRSALEASCADLVNELRLSIDFYSAQEGVPPIERIVLGGPGIAIPGIAENLAPQLGLPITVGRPAALGDADLVSAARLTLPYGLALEE